MTSLIRYGLVLVFAFIALSAQAAGKEHMEEFMFQSGKIYVFVAVSGVILLGFIFYLVALDRKIGRMEKESREDKKQA